jgi:hypothetical protein
LSEKAVKAFTAPRKPKSKELLLCDIRWIRFEHKFWYTPDKHPAIKDHMFYQVLDYGGMINDFYFCNEVTWDNYMKARNGSYSMNWGSLTNLPAFIALYKLLTMKYYDET